MGQYESEGRNGSQEGAQDLRDERILAGQFAEALQLLDAHDRAFDKAALEADDVLVLLSKFAYDTSRSDGVTAGAGHGSGAIEQLIKLIVTGLVGGKSGQRVLDDRVFHTRFAELSAELGILCDGDALVVDENRRSGILKLLGQCINDCLFAFQYLCVGHVCHLR